MAALAYKSYESTRHAWEGFLAVHGCYEGLSTGVWTHAHTQVLVPLQGRLHITSEGFGEVIGPERAALIPAGTPHAATTLGGRLDFLALNVPPGWLSGLGVAIGCPLPADVGVTLLADTGVWLAGRQLAEALDTRRPGFERLLAAGAEQLGLYAVQALASPVAAESDPMVQAIDFVLRHYAEPLTVQDLATQAYLSPRQYERRFKAATGMAPRQFLISVRLAAARDLLATTEETVEAIAGRVGFGNVSHFTRTFTQAMGMSPTAYRRRLLR
jgi:AraC-like DNA-binding protein